MHGSWSAAHPNGLSVNRVQNFTQNLLFSVFAFVFGATVGSFLNVCIYRWPVDLSINRPRRSFCPQCKQPIPWHHNLPLISWLVLGGRCANCMAKISFRYFAVELVTALLFLAIWQRFPWQMAIVGRLLKLVPIALFDRMMAKRPGKPRKTDEPPAA